MGDEWERIWMEALVVSMRYYLRIFLKGLRKLLRTSFRIAGNSNPAPPEYKSGALTLN
jgi:hypothetical protein